MEIQQLRGFIACARTGSVSEAAVKTSRTQPAVSLQIQSLEDEFQITLFERIGKRRLVLTEEGKLFFKLTAPILDDLENVEKRFKEARGEESRGALRLATHSSVIVYLLPEIIRKLRKRNPDSEISIISRERKEILAMLRNGEVDIGITSLSAVPSDVNYQVFARFKRILLLPKVHPLAKRRKISLENISEYPLILPPKGSRTREIVELKLRERGLNYKIALEVVGRDAAKKYVSMGLGVSIVNEYYLSSLDKKQLSVKNVSNIFGEAERGVLTRKSSYLCPMGKEFIGIIPKWS
jgi:DNA-binding transcriptional LysR family regulator